VSKKTKSPHLYILIFFVIAIFLYLVRLRQLFIKNSDKIKTNQQVRIFAVINSIPAKNNGWQSFKIGQFFAKTNNDYNFFYGQRLKIVGKIEKRVINPFYSQFWLLNPEIFFYESLSTIEKEHFRKSTYMTWSLKEKLINTLDKIRQEARMIFYQLLPSPNSDLMAGIVLGSQEKFDNTLHQALTTTGTLHIIAASGMNVTLVAKVLVDWLVILVNRKRAYLVSVVAILIYCLVAGGGAAVVRAGLMASLTLLGLAVGRESKAGWLLLLAGGIMLLVNPYLLFDTGFQLSFAAMAGMIFIKPRLCSAYDNLLIFNSLREGKERLGNEILVSPSESNSRKNTHDFKKLNGARIVKAHKICCLRRSLQDNSQNLSVSPSPKEISGLNWLSSLIMPNFLDTLSAQIATFPILYFTFGQVQPLSFLPNLFVLPVVPLIMMLGFIILFCGLIYLPLAFPVAWLAWPLLTYFVKVIEWWGTVLK
jgi:ComEC/Rec2-related protein